MDNIDIPTPDDWHLHLRDGELMEAVIPATNRWFGRVAVMPNLVPPITTVAQAGAYRARIIDAGAEFDPHMLLYLTEKTTPAVVDACAEHPWMLGFKMYPAHATTNSAFGVSDLSACDGVFKRMSEKGVPLLIHGEVTESSVDVFDRESVFIESTLAPLRERFPKLRMCLEHITTAAAVRFIRSVGNPELMAATITAHHLWQNRNAMFQGGLRPHAYCLPVLKREEDRLALVDAATSGEPAFFFGSDSAPHLRHKKESSCGCAGVFSAETALATVVEVFEANDALVHVEGFLSTHGAAFYRMEHATTRFRLKKDEWSPELALDCGVVQFRGGEKLSWRGTKSSSHGG